MTMTQVNLDKSTLAILDACAEFRSLLREEMLKQAINEAADYDRHVRAKVAKGLKDIAKGLFYASEEVDRRAEARIARFLQKQEADSE